MDNQSIEQCKYLLLARCSRLEYNLDRAQEDPDLSRYAEKYADKLLNLTPREAFSGSELELFLDHYCLALYIENYDWARRSVRHIENLAAGSTECICLF